MVRFTGWLVIELVLAGVPRCYAQTPDYSKEASVIEEDSIQVEFQNDGGSTRKSSGRVRIQSEAGVKKFGVLEFPFQASSETVDLDYVRVHKPDGSTVSTPSDNAQDLDADITRQAPFYSDLRQKHVAVRGLGVGDVLEYHVTWHTTKPIAPGQFWGTFGFSEDGIVLHSSIEVSVPLNRPVKWKSTISKPEISDQGDRRIFKWTFTQIQNKSTEQDEKDAERLRYQMSRGRLPQAEIQISSFQSWEEVGRWYDALQRERVAPVPEIRAKAAELTRGLTSDEAKAKALYNYVGTQFHYIGISFGVGRYQPHFAADVLGNRYGDCKDKHTLFASLLEAAGIAAYPALINSAADIDADVPSPAQFDHLITVIPGGDHFTWLDTTPEVAPYAYLMSGLRDKHALVVLRDKPAQLMMTPSLSSLKSLEVFRMDAKLSDTGVLDGKAAYSESGSDGELVLRSAFRLMPQPKWKDLLQQISYSTGFAGEVDDATASSPEKTDEPFRFSYHYTRKDYPDWTNHRINPPSPAMQMPPLPEKDRKPEYPIWLGPRSEAHYESNVELPKGYRPELPKSVDVDEDFAEYHASYKFKNGILTTDRQLVIKQNEVPPGKQEEYKKFIKTIAEDSGKSVPLSSGTSLFTYEEAIWNLPYSENAEAAKAYDDARAKAQLSDTQGEIALLNHALEMDPKFTRAWLWLGQIQRGAGHVEQALESYRRAIKTDPEVAVSYKALGSTLLQMQKYDEAIPVFRDLIRVDPSDGTGQFGLGSCLFALAKYDEAAAALDEAAKINPEDPAVFLWLGSAYLHSSEKDKALPAYKKAVDLSPTPVFKNKIAYDLAEANTELATALEYAAQAVSDTSAASVGVKLELAGVEDLARTAALAFHWDTLGWVHFRLGNLELAEKYLNASWILSENAAVADHLGQLYEAQKKKAAAIHMYRLAVERSPANSGKSRKRLDNLAPALPASHKLEMEATEELDNLRTTKLTRAIDGSGSADFLVVLGRNPQGSGASIREVKFVSGTETLRSAGAALRSVPVKAEFPDDSQPLLLRRGTLVCGPYSGCALTFLYPEDAQSVN
jgi:tetratricopeptide (TPR) repeat protein/transglutaminase-like putative cysteine protease